MYVFTWVTSSGLSCSYSNSWNNFQTEIQTEIEIDNFPMEANVVQNKVLYVEEIPQWSDMTDTFERNK